jgi:hypothetical protein
VVPCGNAVKKRVRHKPASAAAFSSAFASYLATPRLAGHALASSNREVDGFRVNPTFISLLRKVDSTGRIRAIVTDPPNRTYRDATNIGLQRTEQSCRRR